MCCTALQYTLTSATTAAFVVQWLVCLATNPRIGEGGVHFTHLFILPLGLACHG